MSHQKLCTNEGNQNLFHRFGLGHESKIMNIYLLWSVEFEFLARDFDPLKLLLNKLIFWKIV